MQQRYYYQEDDKLDSGLNGTVFRAYDQQLNIFVALKRMPIKQQLQEIQTLKHIPPPLTPHDDTNHLITYLDFFATDTTHNLVMELFDNSINLQQFLQDHAGRIATPIALQIFHQMCRGIKALHALNIVHRDIKPANVLVRMGPLRVKIVDFGYAVLLNDFQLFESCAGSPAYMSPQNIQGQGYDGKANDIWSLGITLFQMVCGYFPCTTQDKTDLDLRGLEFDIKDIVIECLQQEESDRIDIEQLLWKVESKLKQNLKTFDSSFKPLPKCNWKEISNDRPKINTMEVCVSALTIQNTMK